MKKNYKHNANDETSSKKEKKPMSKKSKILAIFSGIAIALVLAFGCGFGFGYVDPSLSNPLVVDAFYSEWMSYIDQTVTLNKVIMPGSHDSGCNGMMAQAMTQGHDIADQLKGGVRYFDTRVTYKGNDLVIYHGPVKGQSFLKVLDEHRAFIDAHPSEFVILDFQHLGDSAHQATIDAIKSKFDMTKMLKSSDYPNIASVSFKTLRDNGYNFMIVWTSKSQTEKVEASNNNFYIRDDALLSQYDGKVHKDNDEALIAKFAEYYSNHEANKMFVLQAQRTASTFLGKPSVYEKKFKSKVNEYVKNIKNNAEILEKTNVIMRDFVVSDMENVKLILGLNLAKNTVKSADVALFGQFVSV